MALRYCFEADKVKRTLEKCRKNDLAVIDVEGNESAVKSAVKRGVYVYGYLNAGALERERPFYPLFKHLRLAKYDGWDGEYWIDPTDMAWQQHLISEAKRMKSLGVIGLYFDNTDIYYMVTEGFRNPMKAVPSTQSVYNALSSVIRKINALGMIVMPNGGDTFVRKFSSAYPSVIKTVNQEGVLYQDNKKQSAEDTKYQRQPLLVKFLVMRLLCLQLMVFQLCIRIINMKLNIKILLKSKVEIKNTKTSFRPHVTTTCAPISLYNKKASIWTNHIEAFFT